MEIERYIFFCNAYIFNIWKYNFSLFIFFNLI